MSATRLASVFMPEDIKNRIIALKTLHGWTWQDMIDHVFPFMSDGHLNNMCIRNDVKIRISMLKKVQEALDAVGAKKEFVKAEKKVIKGRSRVEELVQQLKDLGAKEVTLKF